MINARKNEIKNLKANEDEILLDILSYLIIFSSLYIYNFSIFIFNAKISKSSL